MVRGSGLGLGFSFNERFGPWVWGHSFGFQFRVSGLRVEGLVFRGLGVLGADTYRSVCLGLAFSGCYL